MQQEQTAISAALVEIDGIKTVQLGVALETMLSKLDDIEQSIDRIEFSMDSVEVTSTDSDGQVYIGVYKPNDIDENLSYLTELINDIKNGYCNGDPTGFVFETAIDLKKDDE